MEASRAEGKRSLKEDDQEEEEDDEDSGGGIAGDEDKIKKKGKRGSSSAGAGGATTFVSCQVENCRADMTDAKKYHRRHKVCDFHAKAPVVRVEGLAQRFCQQCSRSAYPIPNSTSIFIFIYFFIRDVYTFHLVIHSTSYRFFCIYYICSCYGSISC